MPPKKRQHVPVAPPAQHVEHYVYAAAPDMHMSPEAAMAHSDDYTPQQDRGQRGHKRASALRHTVRHDEPQHKEERKTTLDPSVKPLAGGGGIFKSAAVAVLRQERRLMTTGEITRVALERGLIKCQGKTPEATMASALYTDVKRKHDKSVFTRPQEGLFGLREWIEEGFFPEGWEGPPDGLGVAPFKRRGTPQQPKARAAPRHGPGRNAKSRAKDAWKHETSEEEEDEWEEEKDEDDYENHYGSQYQDGSTPGDEEPSPRTGGLRRGSGRGRHARSATAEPDAAAAGLGPGSRQHQAYQQGYPPLPPQPPPQQQQQHGQQRDGSIDHDLESPLHVLAGPAAALSTRNEAASFRAARLSDAGDGGTGRKRRRPQGIQIPDGQGLDGAGGAGPSNSMQGLDTLAVLHEVATSPLSSYGNPLIDIPQRGRQRPKLVVDTMHLDGDHGMGVIHPNVGQGAGSGGHHGGLGSGGHGPGSGGGLGAALQSLATPSSLFHGLETPNLPPMPDTATGLPGISPLGLTGTGGAAAGGQQSQGQSGNFVRPNPLLLNITNLNSPCFLDQLHTPGLLTLGNAFGDLDTPGMLAALQTSRGDALSAAAASIFGPLSGLTPRPSVAALASLAKATGMGTGGPADRSGDGAGAAPSGLQPVAMLQLGGSSDGASLLNAGPSSINSLLPPPRPLMPSGSNSQLQANGLVGMAGLGAADGAAASAAATVTANGVPTGSLQHMSQGNGVTRLTPEEVESNLAAVGRVQDTVERLEEKYGRAHPQVGKAWLALARMYQHVGVSGPVGMQRALEVLHRAWNACKACAEACGAKLSSVCDESFKYLERQMMAGVSNPSPAEMAEAAKDVVAAVAAAEGSGRPSPAANGGTSPKDLDRSLMPPPPPPIKIDAGPAVQEAAA